MKKILLILFIPVSFVLIAADESPEMSFNKLKQAACQSNADEFLARVNLQELTISNYKNDNSDATEADLKAFMATPEFTEKVKKTKENFQQAITQKDNPVCKFKLLSSKIKGNTASLHILEDPDNPYLIFNYIFKKNGDKWQWSALDEELINAPIKVTADELGKDYASNTISADRDYKGKVLQITGEIFQVDKDKKNNIYIALGTKLLPDVYCFVKKSHYSKVTELEAGKEITITGICTGKQTYVLMNECVF